MSKAKGQRSKIVKGGGLPSTTFGVSRKERVYPAPLLKLCFRSGAGFTFIELAFAVAIILIISGVVFANFRGGEQSLALERSAHKIAQDIRRSIGLSLQAQSEPAGCGGGGDLSGYGMYFDKAVTGSYILFADCNGNGNYEGDPPDDIVETISVDPVVEISNVAPEATGKMSVIFKPPHPEIIIDPSANQTLEVTIRLKDDTSQTRTIIVNERGVIDIN